MSLPAFLKPHPTGVYLAVKLQPRASKNEVVGLHDGCLKLRITAPPVEGAANEAVVRPVAETLGIPRRQVRLVSGSTGRRKVLEIEGVSEAQLAGLSTVDAKP